MREQAIMVLVVRRSLYRRPDGSHAACTIPRATAGSIDQCKLTCSRCSPGCAKSARLVLLGRDGANNTPVGGSGPEVAGAEQGIAR